MALKPSVAVFDACILYPFHLRNIVVQAAVDRLVEPRWTDAIHEEWIRGTAAVVRDNLASRAEILGEFVIVLHPDPEPSHA